MITGDYPETAIAIAKECKLIDTWLEKYTVLTGPELEDLTGGLICLNCEKKIPCECKKEDVQENVKDMHIFKIIRS